MNSMGIEDDQSGLVAVAVFLAVLVAAIWAVQVLPGEVSRFLMAWTISSFPIGMLIGHCCALSED
jgi:steroid 5-alpha reductase family enzyme